MNPITDRILALAVVALVGIGGGLYVKALRADLATAQSDARTAQEAVVRRDATIDALQKKARDNAIAIAQLEAKRQGIAASLARYETDFEALKHENETVRAWADGALPDDVMRLYDRPTITGANDFLSAMRARRALHAAGDGPAN
jgi:LysB family phage lysis regulatory protein